MDWTGFGFGILFAYVVPWGLLALIGGLHYAWRRHRDARARRAALEALLQDTDLRIPRGTW